MENDIINNIGKERYFKNGETSWNEVYKRVANYVMDTDEEKDYIYNLMKDDKFKPNSPCLMNAGMDKPMMSACFALSIDDDLISILKTFSNASIVMKSGGGVGINYSPLRPKDDPISNTNGSSSGVISFMSMFDKGVDVIQQGSSRRGAEIGTLDVSHPQIEDFIDAKLEDGKLSNMNISVRVTDKFMEAVEKDEDFNLEFNGKVYKTVKAKYLFNKIVHNAWKSAEPGLVFIDTVLKAEPYECTKEEIGCNPCGEVILRTENNAGESCNLASINLSKYIDNKDINWVALEKDVQYVVTFLDNVIDKNYYPVKEIEEITKKYRRLGLGIMGFHDALILMELPYDSEDGREKAKEIMNFIHLVANKKSMELGYTKGNYIAYEGSNCKRNHALTCIAPTGCQKGDTIITTTSGLFKLNELNNTSGDIWQNKNLEVITDNGIQHCDKFYVNGKQLTKKILLSSGIEMECTYNHMYRIFDVNDNYIWKRADELCINDRLAIMLGGYENDNDCDLIYTDDINFNSIHRNFPNKMNTDLAWLLGIMYGDGSVHDKGLRIHCNRNDIELKNKIVSTIFKIFGYKATTSSERTCDSIYINSQAILKWLNVNNILKQKSNYVDVPLAIRTSSKKVIESFIDGYWEADGSTNGHSKYIDTISHDMAQTLSCCMRAIGINSKIYKYTFENDKSHKGKNPVYRIYYLKFPIESKSHVSKEKQNNYKLASTINENMYIDTITDIIDSECETYDISVPYNNTYIANSVVSHNTIATISDCSYGIEPIFALKHTRTTWVDGTPKTYNMVASVVDQVLPLMEAEGLDIKKIKEHIFKTGSIQKCDSASTKWKSILKTAMEIEPKDHILMQATFQNNGVDNSISKTVNLKSDATEKDIYYAYMIAWKTGCKGITVYRDGSKKTQVLKTEDYKEIEDKQKTIINTSNKRPDVLSGTTYKKVSGCGKLYITVNEKDGKPYEIIVQTSGIGGCAANTEAIGRAISAGLRNGVSVTEYIRQLSRVICPKCKNGKPVDGKSCADIIGKCLSMGVEYENEISKKINETPTNENKTKCPECGEEISMMEGCMTCLNCGYSKCS